MHTETRSGQSFYHGAEVFIYKLYHPHICFSGSFSGFLPFPSFCFSLSLYSSLISTRSEITLQPAARSECLASVICLLLLYNMCVCVLCVWIYKSERERERERESVTSSSTCKAELDRFSIFSLQVIQSKSALNSDSSTRLESVVLIQTQYCGSLMSMKGQNKYNSTRSFYPCNTRKSIDK